MEQATHITMNDVAKKRKKGTRQPISDPSYFPKIMVTFRALILILFGTMSPLFMDIDELYGICLEGHQRQIFQAMRTKRPGWFAHLLWNPKILENNDNGNWFPKPNSTPMPHGVHDTTYLTFWTFFTRWHPQRISYHD